MSAWPTFNNINQIKANNCISILHNLADSKPKRSSETECDQNMILEDDPDSSKDWR